MDKLPKLNFYGTKLNYKKISRRSEVVTSDSLILTAQSVKVTFAPKAGGKYNCSHCGNKFNQNQTQVHRRQAENNRLSAINDQTRSLEFGADDTERTPASLCPNVNFTYYVCSGEISTSETSCKKCNVEVRECPDCEGLTFANCRCCILCDDKESRNERLTCPSCGEKQDTFKNMCELCGEDLMSCIRCLAVNAMDQENCRFCNSQLWQS